MNRTTRGTVIALGVAALFTTGTAFADSGSDAQAPHDAKKDAKVACTGVNECKGKGVVMMGADDCQKKGGKVAAN